MSVLEVWRVWYQEGGPEKSRSFDFFDLDNLKAFVDSHDVISKTFRATGLPEGISRYITSKGVYEEEISKEDVASLSPQWIDDRRKRY